MNKPQILVSVIALVLAVVLFQLPRVVVENEQLQDVSDEQGGHQLEISEDVRARMQELRSLIAVEENLDKKSNFAHSLARYYLDYGVLDSAASLGASIVEWNEGPSELALDVYYKAYERSQNSEDARTYAGRAKEIIEQLLENDPANIVLKNKLAMTLVTSENPMAGINLLREALLEDENNRLTIMNLGLLAIQSGQFDRARNRFEKLVELDPLDHEARLYLAVAMMELNEQTQAKLLLEEILESSDSIPAIKMMALDYLNGL